MHVYNWPVRTVHNEELSFNGPRDLDMWAVIEGSNSYWSHTLKLVRIGLLSRVWQLTASARARTRHDLTIRLPRLA